ncbi:MULTISPECIES: hypothetical protein [Pseudanabaena]|uniref:Uncharacterized protein n=2 Tax=Pseudanabaena TaxID=1152 RepID=L8MUQ0_9CYAN|nr:MULTISPECIES: hypothetical protein [Pseudanabaena]ELS30534.1 hypothetical protein Pse7429DRAFT_4397 [Pseudanabaena biceps PCC 7429]MDG3497198.1 hypothetical protein [Pseudanabaena catenata USMAC16]
MEPVSSLIVGLLLIVGIGSLTKVGENITDETLKLARSLWAVLSHKAPNTQTVKAINAGEDFDARQAVIDVGAIADDPDVVKLLEQVRSLLSSNQELAAKVEALQLQQSQSKFDNPNKLAEKIGVVVQSGGKADIQTLNM